MALFFNSSTQNGGLEDDFLFGTPSSGANVTLNGNDGNDLLWGDSGDFFSTTTFSPSFGTSAANAVNIDSAINWSLRENPDIADATTVPHTTIYESVTGADRQLWYAVTVGAGETITLDIDYGLSSIGDSLDTIVTLFEADGITQVATNDDDFSDPGASGSTSARDSFLTHTATTAGTYLIRVSEFGAAGEISPDATFLLNVSVTGHAATGSATGGDDVLNGGAGEDILYGMGGDDTLNGGEGNDTMDGGSGNDVFFAVPGVNTMLGGSGNDQLFAFTSQDTIGQVFDGGADTDRLSIISLGGVGAYDLRDDTLQNIELLQFFDNGSGPTFVPAEIMVNAAQMDDVTQLIASPHAGGNVQLTVDMAARSTLDLSALTVIGFTLTGDTITVNGDGDSETITGSGIADVIFGNGGNDSINGGFGNDTINGGFGNDTMDGGSGNDVLFAVPGVNTMLGGSGNDQLFAFTSQDTIGQVFNGGADTDRLSIISLGGVGAYDLRDDTLQNIELLQFFDNGSGPTFVPAEIMVNAAQLDDVTQLIASPHAGGNVQLTVDMAARSTLDLSALTVIGFTLTGDTITVNGDGDSETITGSGIADVIFGNGGNDTLNGGEGNDTMDGGSGNDVFFAVPGVNTMLGGSGNDQLFAFTSQDTIGQVFDGGADTDRLSIISLGGVGAYDLRDDTLQNIELLQFFDNGSGPTFVPAEIMVNAAQMDDVTQLIASPHAGGNVQLTVDMAARSTLDLSALTVIGFTLTGDTITVNGDGDSETITGSGIADVIFGNGGNDSINGGFGNDTINGGFGNDTMDGGSGNDVLFAVPGVNTMLGGSGNDQLFAFTSQDTIGQVFNGGADTDRLSIISLGGVGAYDLRDDTLQNIELLQFFDNGSGPTFVPAEIMVNAAQLDDVTQLIASPHAGGNVQLTVDMAARSTLDLSALTVIGFTIPGDNITINGDLDNETITGSGIADVIFGNGGNDSINGGLGNDTITDGGGRDTVDAGAGNDTVFVTFAGAGESFEGGAGIDTVNFTLDNGGGQTINLAQTSFNFFSATVSGFENVVDGFGSNKIIGSSVANVLDGGGGNDTLSYEASSTGVNVDIDMNTASGGDAAGDTILNFENLQGSAHNDTLSGNSGDNTIIGGNGDDVLSGGAGNDVLNSGGGLDFLTGGSGADTLQGGNGRDTAVYTDSALGVSINMGTNTYSGGDATGDVLLAVEDIYGSLVADTITGDSSSNLLLGNQGADLLDGGSGNVRDVLLGGSQNDTMLGNDGNDILNGGGGNDRLFGGGGGDVLVGGNGSDIFIGGSGVDIFVFQQGSWGADIITDWQDGLDRIRIVSDFDATDATLAQQGSDVLFTLTPTGDTILFQNTLASDLDFNSYDFIFI